MPAEERQTHRNLQVYFMERAKAAGVKEQKEDEEELKPSCKAHHMADLSAFYIIFELK